MLGKKLKRSFAHSCRPMQLGGWMAGFATSVAFGEKNKFDSSVGTCLWTIAVEGAAQQPTALKKTLRSTKLQGLPQRK